MIRIQWCDEKKKPDRKRRFLSGACSPSPLPCANVAIVPKRSADDADRRSIVRKRMGGGKGGRENKVFAALVFL